MKSFAIFFVFCGALIACGAEVTSQGENQSSPSSSSSTSAKPPPTGAGGAGEGGGNVTDPGPPPQPCVPEPEGGGGTPVKPDCSDLGGLSVSNPTLTDENGNGLFEAGETLSLTLKLNETQGRDFMWYPGVLFESTHPGASVPAEYWFYGIFACQSHEVPVTIALSPGLPKNTKITISARVGMLNENCPNSSSLQIPFEIQ